MEAYGITEKEEALEETLPVIKHTEKTVHHRSLWKIHNLSAVGRLHTKETL